MIVKRPTSVHPNVNSLDDYRRFAYDQLAKQGKSPVLVEREEQPVAYVSDDRRVCLCVCENGCSSSPEWGIAICCLCGSVYHPIFPDNLNAVEEALSHRPTQYRSFFPDPIIAFKHNVILLTEDGKSVRGETVDDLLRENGFYKEQSIENQIKAFELKLRGNQ